MSKTIAGTGISEGKAVGKLLIYQQKKYHIPVEGKGIEIEQTILKENLEKVYEELEQMIKELPEDSEQVEILETHMETLEDDELTERLQKRIQTGVSAAKAVHDELEETAERFAAIKNEYLAARAADVRDIQVQLEQQILGIKKRKIGHLEEDCILVCNELTPSDTGKMDQSHIAGILMLEGSYNSHAAIIARALHIPAITGVKELPGKEQEGLLAYIDGFKGELVIQPEEALIEEGQKYREDTLRRENQRKKLIGKKSMLSDGTELPVYANIASPEDLEAVLENDAEGIGLMRSEFLYLGQKELPSEEKQYQIYRSILEKMKEKSVIVRTLDIGGDKESEIIQMEKEQNPFLGVRGIRLCLRKRDLFRTQLRALLRASVYGNLHIMFPMIADLRELRDAKKELELAKKELYEAGIAFRDDIPVGMMMEVPAAALLAETFAEECDFFSIGTNDLTQYTMAVDRGNTNLMELYSHYQPGVIALISNIVKAAQKNNILCGVCGESAADKNFLHILAGLGVDEVSVSASHVLEIRESLLQMETSDCKKLTEFVLQAKTVDEVIQIMKEEKEA